MDYQTKTVSAGVAPRELSGTTRLSTACGRLNALNCQVAELIANKVTCEGAKGDNPNVPPPSDGTLNTLADYILREIELLDNQFAFIAARL